MIVHQDKKYKKDLEKETALWDKAATDELKKFPPDYIYYKETLPYKIYRHKYVLEMLSHINPGDKVLELGCYNGWFSLEMARKGAFVYAHDISSNAISVAKTYYKKRKGIESFNGTISYFITDLNFPNFARNSFNKIVIRNVLHHLINLDELYKKLFEILNPGGLILIDDALPAGKLEAFIAGVLLFLLPSDIPYSQKIKRVFKKGNILKRTQGLIDSKDSSPFEGISGEESFQKAIFFFPKNRKITYSAFIGAVTPRLNIPIDIVKYCLLKSLNFLDSLLIKIKIIKGTVYYLIGTKIDKNKETKHNGYVNLKQNEPALAC